MVLCDLLSFKLLHKGHLITALLITEAATQYVYCLDMWKKGMIHAPSETDGWLKIPSHYSIQVCHLKGNAFFTWGIFHLLFFANSWYLKLRQKRNYCYFHLNKLSGLGHVIFFTP